MNARVRHEATQAAVGEEASGELDSLLRAPSARKPAAATAAVCLGRIVSVDARGVAGVEYSGSAGTLAARLAVASPDRVMSPTMQVGQEVVLTFENGDPALPIILGFIQPPPSPGEAHSDAPAARADSAMQVIEADVDGKRVRIVAQDEIVLQCGEASVTLRRNGRIVIRGTYVETCSEGTNRIKGGQVRIN